MSTNLDMLTDEPLELAIELRRLAEANSAGIGGKLKDWRTFAAAMADLVRDLKALNEPGVTEGASEGEQARTEEPDGA